MEGLDISLRRVFEEVRRAGGTLIVTADHGNCEVMVERNGKGEVQYLANGTPVPKKSHTPAGAVRDARLPRPHGAGE